MFELQDKLRPLQRNRVAGCRRVRVSPLVAVRYSPLTERAHFGGLSTCACVWGCPICSAVIRAGRAEEVRRVVEQHGHDKTYMASFTVRHGMGHALKPVRQGVARAFQRMIRGEPWKRFCTEHGIIGCIRALEVTHGPQHGWHPHLHVLMLAGSAMAQEVLAAVRNWLTTRWQHCVERSLGSEHCPDYEHGVDFSPCNSAQYLSKLGLELTAPGRG